MLILTVLMLSRLQAVVQIRGANVYSASSGEKIRKLVGAGLEHLITPVALRHVPLHCVCMCESVRVASS